MHRKKEETFVEPKEAKEKLPESFLHYLSLCFSAPCIGRYENVVYPGVWAPGSKSCRGPKVCQAFF